MRLKLFIALVAALMTSVVALSPASATDLARPDLRPYSYHRTYGPYPYAYFYEPRGWYPYYNSGEWGPRYKKRYKGVLPPYYAAQGANKRNYHHVEWHRFHYGGHWRGDW
jgi:hypothetical protein